MRGATMPRYKLWQKAIVWYSAEVQADDENHARRLHNAGMVEDWSMNLDTVQNEEEFEVELIPEHFHLWQIHEDTAKCVECGLTGTVN
jgi:cytochrome c-type biogenesis protein CcmE